MRMTAGPWYPRLPFFSIFSPYFQFCSFFVLFFFFVSSSHQTCPSLASISHTPSFPLSQALTNCSYAQYFLSNSFSSSPFLVQHISLHLPRSVLLHSFSYPANSSFPFFSTPTCQKGSFLRDLSSRMVPSGLMGSPSGTIAISILCLYINDMSSLHRWFLVVFPQSFLLWIGFLDHCHVRHR